MVVVLYPVSNNTLQCWKNMLYSIKNGIGGHRYATLHCHAGLWQVIADELIRLEVVDYITDTTVCEVMKKQNQTMACEGMVHSGSGRRIRSEDGGRAGGIPASLCSSPSCRLHR